MSRRHWRFCSSAVCSVVGLAVSGCMGDDGQARQPISGSVTLNGQRLQDGVITFFPAKRLIEGRYVIGGSTIADGRFALSRAEGLIPARYKVAVHSGDTIKREKFRAEREPGNDVVVPKELIPTKYNSDTILEIEIQNHAIKDLKIAITSE